MERRIRISFLLTTAIFFIGAVCFYGCNLKTKSDQKKIETVTRGKVTASFKCPGQVVSATDVFILNPVRNTVKGVLKTAGSWVEKGDVILILEDEKIEAEIEQLSNQLKQKQNLLDRSRLNIKNLKIDLEHTGQAKQNRVDRLKSTLAQQEKMLEAEGISIQRVEQTRQDLKLAEIDLINQAEKNTIRIKQLKLDQQNIELQISAYRKQLNAKKGLLFKMKVTAPVSGILAEVNASVGERVELDRILARISANSSLKILCSASKEKTKQIQPGMKVQIAVGGNELAGTIGQVYIEGDSLNNSFDVNIATEDFGKLALGQSTEVLVPGNDKENVLRIRKLPGVKLAQQFDVIVLKDEESVRTEIVLGVIGKDYCEVISGVNEGDEILVVNPEKL